MKSKGFIIILLAIGLAIVSFKWASNVVGEQQGEEAGAQPASESSTIADIMSRTSVRSYTEEKIKPEQVDTLLKAAMAAPTAGNRQPWRFVVITERNVLDYIGETFQSMKMMKGAPLAILVCGDVEATFPGEGRDYWIEDTSAATENLLLAAHAMGLGAVWCGIYPLPDRVKQFSSLMHLPENVLPLGCVAVGHPDGEFTPKDKWKPEYVHYECWDSLPPTIPKKQEN